jgi:hypothetical protein
MALHFAKFMSYTIGHLEEWPLPPPAHTAATLREQALDLIYEWSLHYGDIYPQLRMGYRSVHQALQAAWCTELEQREAAPQQLAAGCPAPNPRLNL